MVTIYKNIFDKVPNYISVDKALERIKIGKSRVQVLEIREQIDKERANKLKCNLPSVCFSGEFKEREDAKIIKHSGYIILDFDNIENLESKKKEAAKKNINVDEDIDLKSFNYASAKAHNEYYKGQIAELDFKIKSGELYSKLEVQNTVFEANRLIRDMILNLKSKLPARVIGQKDIKKIEEIINHECLYIITNLYTMEDLSK